MKSYILSLIIFVLITYPINSQTDTLYNRFESGQLKEVIPLYQNIREGIALFYNEAGVLLQEISYKNGRVEGLVKNYNEKGYLRELFSIEDGKRNGPTSFFDSVGVYIGDKDYDFGRLVIPAEVEQTLESSVVKEDTEVKPTPKESHSKPSAITTKKQSNTISIIPADNNDDNLEDDPAYFLSVEVLPQPIGGYEKIQERVNYPELARKKKIQGTVKIKAFIDRYGDVEKTEIVEGIGYGCDEAAEITVYYTRFSPGIIRGKAVKVQMIIPVEFKLN